MTPRIRDEGEILRAWRKRLRLNQVQAGAVLGRTDRSIQIYEKTGDVPLAVRQAAAGVELRTAIAALVEAIDEAMPADRPAGLTEAVDQANRAVAGADELIGSN